MDEWEADPNSWKYNEPDDVIVARQEDEFIVQQYIPDSWEDYDEDAEIDSIIGQYTTKWAE